MSQNKSTILVTGSRGQVGRELQYWSPKFKQFRFIFVDVAELDITDRAAVDMFFQKNHIAYCLNCAAYTAVDKAESEPEIARLVNVEGVKNLAENCQKTGALFIQLSTDYVYHTGQNIPFKEDAPTHPQGIYALTKLQGDEAALANNGMVIRTSWVYSSFGNNFVKTMLRLGAERESLNVIFDQIGTPTYARDLAQAMLIIVQKAEYGQRERSELTGIFHYSNEGVTSWYDFAKAIFHARKMRVKLFPIETKDYPTPACRPPFSVLNKAKIKAAFGLQIPHWQDSLRACLSLLKGEGRSD